MALVVDSEKSEKSPQRRLNHAGRRLHCCCICGDLSVWSDGWSTYCSEADIDDSVPIPKFCSEKCRIKGGPKAIKVTIEMKSVARTAEWREPDIVYREQTELEKYADAAYRQRSKPVDETKYR